LHFSTLTHLSQTQQWPGRSGGGTAAEWPRTRGRKQPVHLHMELSSLHPEKLLDDFFHGKSIYKWFSSWKILFFTWMIWGIFPSIVFFMK
jgi:hypothetical protein